MPGRHGRRPLPDSAPVEPVRFLQTWFQADDWIAVFLKNNQSARVAQRVGPLSWAMSDHVLAWLNAMNAQRFDVNAASMRSRPAGGRALAMRSRRSDTCSSRLTTTAPPFSHEWPSDATCRRPRTC